MAKTYEENINADLGLGTRVAQESRLRFLNRDGSFNVERGGVPILRRFKFYHVLLTISWPRFFLLILGIYLLANTLFALLFVACGPNALYGVEGTAFAERFRDAFFFSVQTLTTIGYGHVSPQSVAANVVVAIEALVGLLALATGTGLLFARFSHPNAKIIFSEQALIAPYKKFTAFEFRIANQLNSELIDVNATVVFTRIEEHHGERSRRFYALALERPSVMFFPLHWVVVHPITETSPLYGMDARAMEEGDVEFLVLLTAFDEIFSQTVHTRTSYKYHEIVWNARFSDLFVPSPDGKMAIDMRKIHDFEGIA